MPPQQVMQKKKQRTVELEYEKHGEHGYIKGK